MANQNNTNSEIDLGELSRKAKSFFSSIGDAFFEAILFFRRYFIVVILLLAAGIALGFYKDQSMPRYMQKMFVVPNFGSVDYLYEAIETLNTKADQNDYSFLSQIGIKDPSAISKIEIDPVVDIYGFANINPYAEEESPEYVNYQIFRLMSEKGDINKVMEDKVTARNYKNHIITITTKGRASKEDVLTPILNYFNTNSYYKKLQEQGKKDLDMSIASKEASIKHIDDILTSVSQRTNSGSLVAYNDNTDLSELVKNKNKLVVELAQNKIDRINYDDVVKEGSSMLNIKDPGITSGRMKYIYPILFILLFMLGVRFVKFYKKQVEKRKKVVVNE